MLKKKINLTNDEKKWRYTIKSPVFKIRCLDSAYLKNRTI